MRHSIENRLYRWTRDLPASLRLFNRSTSFSEWEPTLETLAPYSFEARQLHIPYFICLAIMCRPCPGISPSPAVVLASSFVAGMFEDFLARDEIQFLGPIFTFHLLAAGIGLLSCQKIPALWDKAATSLETIYLSLEVLAKRWSSAKGSLRALRSIAEKKQRTTRSDATNFLTLPREHRPFFAHFGPDLSWAWQFFMPSDNHTALQNPQETSPITETADVPLDEFPESRPADAVPSTEDYRPLTTILDPHMGLEMGDMTRCMPDEFFHNQYKGMGDWLFKDLEWTGDIQW